MPKRRGNQEGSLYQRPDGRWQARIRYIDPATGKSKRLSVYADTADAARNKLKEARDRLDAGAPASPPTANLSISKCPPGKPDLHQTRPGQPLATAPPPRASGSSRTVTTARPPSARPDPCGTGRVIALRTLATLGLAAAHIQSRVRGMARRHAHETSPCQPTTATKTESSSCAPDSPLPGSPAID